MESLADDQLRAAQVVHLLESLNTKKAKDLLSTLSKMGTKRVEAREAKAALTRLEKFI